MRRIVPSLFLIAALVGPATGRSAAPAETLTPAQAAAELRLLRRAFVALHPGLYRYRTPEQIDAAFVASADAVRNGASVATMYLQVSRLAAAVRCGHTWTNPLNQSEHVQDLFRRADKLPLRLRVVDERLLITASTDARVRAGDELLAIDGSPAAAVIAELMPYLRADGGSDGKRLAQIDSGVDGGAMDRLFPLLHPPVDDRYVLRVRRRADGASVSVAVSATSVADREAALAAAGEPEPSQAWTLRFDGPVAILTLPTFSFWNGRFDWKGFLDDAFAQVERRGVTRLVLDLRANEGGDGAVGDALLAHLLSTPYTPAASLPEVSFERVPYVLARYLDTWDFDFFDHTGRVERTAGRNYRLLGAREGGTPIQPAPTVYRGRAVALVGPDMSSAGFIVARDLQRSHAALLIGRPTGGNLRGLNGGQLAWLTLPTSGVAVDIPLVAWVPGTPQPDQPIVPDVVVEPRFAKLAAGEDADMEAAMEVLKGTAEAAGPPGS